MTCSSAHREMDALSQADYSAASPAVTEHAILRNAAVALWIAFLIAVGCIIFSGLEEGARRDRCLLRGAALCHDSRSAGLPLSRPQVLRFERALDFAAYLKKSRAWRETPAGSNEEIPFCVLGMGTIGKRAVQRRTLEQTEVVPSLAVVSPMANSAARTPTRDIG